MNGINADSFMLFGFLSMALLLGVFIRSQLKFFQKYMIPGSVIAGFITLIIGPGLLNIVSIPTTSGEVDFLVFNLLSVIFIIIGLRGFDGEKDKKDKGEGTLKFTAAITSLLSFQLAAGMLFALAVVLLINPGLFRGFGSMLMLGHGFDPTMARFFGGFWEQEQGFTGGQSIAFAFSSFVFLMSYLLGLGYIIWTKKRGLITPIPGEESASVQTGILQTRKKKPAAGLLTTHNQSIETFSLHLAIIGLAVLLLYGLLKALALVMIHNLSPGMIILTEIFTNFNYLFGLLMGLAFRRLLIWLKIDYIVNRDVLNRILGVAVDYMVVAAIASIPLVISLANMWETLSFSLIGAGLTLLAVAILMKKACLDDSIKKQVALYGFLTGNISSAVALFRVLDPNLEDPFIRNLTYAGGLSFIAALPLLFFMNIAVVGRVEHMAAAAGLAAIYGGGIFCAWYFLIFRRSCRKQPGNKAESSHDQS